MNLRNHNEEEKDSSPFPILDYLLLDHLDRPKISFELFILMKECKKEGLLPFFHFQENQKSEIKYFSVSSLILFFFAVLHVICVCQSCE